jgi:hypothetical protein
MLLIPTQEGVGLPDLEGIFLENKRQEMAVLLSSEQRISLDLNPLLFDTGFLHREQVLMAFDKLQQRFAIREAKITNSQSDTNYAWLEVYLNLTLEQRKTGLIFRGTFSFQFKITGSQMVIDRWSLQDVH